MKFSIKNFFSKCEEITFTEEILNGKLQFLCSEQYKHWFYKMQYQGLEDQKKGMNEWFNT